MKFPAGALGQARNRVKGGEKTKEEKEEAVGVPGKDVLVYGLSKNKGGK